MYEVSYRETPGQVESATSHFNIAIHEAYGEKEIEGIVRALAKVDAAFVSAEHSVSTAAQAEAMVAKI